MELSLLVTLDATAELPLHRQLYQQIRDAILTGRLKPQTRLPASRQLAKTLGVSRTTVVQSYDQLICEGYLQTKVGAGTFACSQIPDDLLLVESSLADSLLGGDSEEARFEVDCLRGDRASSKALYQLSAYGDRLLNAPDYAGGDDCSLSFRYGLPDLSLFPAQQWRRLVNRVSATSCGWMDYGSEPMGDRGLRREVAQYIRDVRAVRCSPEQILITSGTQQALSLIGRVLMSKGAAIAFEDPGYLSAKRIFSSLGSDIVPVPVDAEGIRVNEAGGLVDVMGDRAAKPRLVYVTPSHQFPTGVLMSLSRRLALLRWAREHGALIVEDDYDSEFRYSGSPIPALQGLDEEGCVLYVGTFSKVMFPGLRLGYIVLPPALVDVFRRAKWLCDRQCSLVDQAALAEFIRGGYLAQHVRRMRGVYDRRRQLLVESLREILPEAVVPGDASGLHVLVRLASEEREFSQMIERARAVNVGLFSAQPHYWSGVGLENAGSGRSSEELILGFGNISEPDIRVAIARIRSLLEGW